MIRSKGIIKDVLIIAGATALSRIFGLVRDVVIADRFGAGAAYDAYIVAFFVPHVLRRLLAEGALSTAFIPIFTGFLTQRGKEAADRFASDTLNLALIFFPILIALGIWLAPYYVPFLADGFTPEKMNLAISLTRITFPFIGLVGIAALFMGVLNGHKHFFAPAFAPVLFNLGVICGALFIASLFTKPIYGLAVGVLVGGMGQLLIQVPFLRGRMRYQQRLFLTKARNRLSSNPSREGVKELAKAMLPAVLGLAGAQINIMVDNKLASHLGDGSISALQYAIRLFQLPLGVFAISISSAVLPRLSHHAALGDKEELINTLRRGIKLCTFVILPAMAGLYVVGKPVIQLLFEHGSFQYQDTLRTLYALNHYLIGMVGYGLVYILIKAFYALHDTRTPVIIGAAAVGVNIIMDYALIVTMREGGLALATSLAGLFNMTLLLIFLQKRLKVALISPIAKELVKMVFGASLMGVSTYLLYSWLTSVFGNELLLAGLPIVFGIILYFGVSKLMRTI